MFFINSLLTTLIARAVFLSTKPKKTRPYQFFFQGNRGGAQQFSLDDQKAFPALG